MPQIQHGQIFLKKRSEIMKNTDQTTFHESRWISDPITDLDGRGNLISQLSLAPETKILFVGCYCRFIKNLTSIDILFVLFR
jgi:hypothetical protein